MKSMYKTYDFSSVVPCQCLSVDEARIVLSGLVSPAGKLSPAITREQFVVSRKLQGFFSSVFYYTEFLPKDAPLALRLHCIHHSIVEFPKCPACGEKIVKYRSNFKFGFNKFCCQKCARSKNNPWDMMSDNSRSVRSRKTSETRKGFVMPQDWKDKLKLAAQKEDVKKKKRDTCLSRYGVENPGVLGAFHSKDACSYIRAMLRELCIDEDRCLFCDPENNRREFFQSIYIPILRRSRYVSYDLVVFESEEACRNLDLSKLSFSFEFNGPWHYRSSQLGTSEKKASVPYRTGDKKLTRLESYFIDKAKVEHIAQFAPCWVYYQNECAMYTIKKGGTFDV